MEYMLFVLDTIGTVAFALSGAMTAIKKKMDILGVVILGMVTAVGGGMIRDIVLGILPPVAGVPGDFRRAFPVDSDDRRHPGAGSLHCGRSAGGL